MGACDGSFSVNGGSTGEGRRPRALTIAGSDSGGGAGIQADLKTFAALGAYGASIVTAITAQNTLGVQAVHPVPVDMVVAQMTSVLDDLGVDAVKIGMIGSAATVHAVADVLEALDVPIVFDPVMIATSGSVLADPDTIAAFERLMGIASVVTPNIPELAALGGEAAVLAHGCHVVAKGGHGDGASVTDRLLSPGGEIRRLIGKRFDTGLADAYFDAAKATSERRLPQSLTADYTAEESILGLFGMTKYVNGGTTLVAGLRVETTNFQSSAPSVSRTGAIVTASGKAGYVDFFPNVTLRQAFTPNLILRAALSRAINRANFPQLAPRVLETTEGNTIRVESGNPRLNPTLANNVDAGLEYYIRPLGVISVNGFYKDLTDYRYTLNRQGVYLGLPAIFSSPINARKGELYGVELNWQQQLSFLPGLLGGLGVFANYTYTQGHATFDGTYGGRSRFALPGQSTHMWNASVFYERGPVNLRVAYTKRSDYLDEINADNPALDLYWEGRGQLDVTGSVQLMKGINLFAEGKNLTNTPGVRYFGERFRTYEYEKFGYSIFAGVRVKL